MFSRKHGEIFNNRYFYRTSLVAASVHNMLASKVGRIRV